MRYLLLIWVAICAMPFLAWADQDDLARYAVQLDESHDRVIERVVVPSSGQPQGEVQLVRRGELVVVRTLLASKVLKRAAAAIDSKEQRNWPDGRDGHLASKRYRAELFRATERAWEAFRHRTDRTEKRQMLFIEFIHGPEQALIALALPQLAGDLGELQILDKEPLKVWSAPAGYVRGNIQHIIQDSFGLDGSTTERLLERLSTE
jgi:hypothetical protein